MGCCQHKDSQTPHEANKESEEGRRARACLGWRRRGGCPGTQGGGPKGQALSRPVDPIGTEGSDFTESQSHRRRKSNESLLITVLWRRLSLFSRRGSSRSTKRQSGQSQRRAFQEPARAGIQEESEKG
ncbi:testis-expressed protein 54 [Tenrec ecaudatus]|uniref:testis-expressed protein 54 n=1 Tax=Tenrec ecaudatus TaxID=94439 RepID=UPI003F5A2A81